MFVVIYIPEVSYDGVSQAKVLMENLTIPIKEYADMQIYVTDIGKLAGLIKILVDFFDFTGIVLCQCKYTNQIHIAVEDQ